MTHISPDFTLEELCASQTARARNLRNIPSTQEICNLCALTHHVLQPLRTWWSRPITIGSGYRTPALNRAVGGVPDSQHTRGQAADLCIDGDMEKARAWFNYIRDNLPFDQLILEHNAKGTHWIHVSYHPTHNRHQVIENLLKK